MEGPKIVVQSMSVPQPRGRSQALWQYHSRSDLHSKVVCWAAIFDMLCTSSLLRQHVESENAVFGVNFEMSDFETGRKKDLDLVIARQASSFDEEGDFRSYAETWGIQLSDDQKKTLEALPRFRMGKVTASGVLMALEAKAAMTAHSKARPRLYDELNSSRLAIHGASSQAMAIGLVLINAGETFVSPGRQRGRTRSQVTTHNQPRDADLVIQKIQELPRRSGSQSSGFDGLGILVVEMGNDGTPVELVSNAPAPPPGDIFNYSNMITRVCNEYDSRFARI